MRMGSSDACGSAFSCLPSFVAGILFVVVVEIVLARYLLRRLLFTSSRSPVNSDLKIQSDEEDHSISLQVTLSLHSYLLKDSEHLGSCHFHFDVILARFQSRVKKIGGLYHFLSTGIFSFQIGNRRLI